MKKGIKIGLYISANNNVYLCKVRNDVIEDTLNFKYNPKEYLDFSAFLNICIQRALEEFRVREKVLLYLSLSSQFILIRFFEFPFLSKKEVIQALPFEAERRLPFKLEDLLWDFKFRVFKKEKTSEVCFVGVNKKDFSKIKEGIKQFDLNLMKIEPAIVSFWRLLYLRKEKMMQRLKTYGVIVIDDEEASFLMLSNHFPCIFRDVKISRKEDLKRFTEELRLSLEYYQRRYKGEVVQSLLFIGKEKYKNYFEELNKEFDLPLYFIGEEKIFSERFSIEELKSYSVTLPSPLRTLISFNVSIKEEKKVEVSKEIPFRKEYIILSSFIFFLIAGFNFIGKFNKFKEKKNQLKIVKRRLLREGIRALKSIEELRSDKVKFKKILAQFEYFKSSKKFFSTILKALSKNLPQGVWIERLSLVWQEEKGSVLFLEGFSYAKEESERMDSIKKFVSNIRKNFFNYFDKIILKEISEGVYKGYRVTSFKIECR